MPLTVITVSVRGWGETPVDSEAKAMERLAQFNTDAQAGNLRARQGTIYRIEEPGNGGPCAPEYIPVQILHAADDLPERQAFLEAQSDDD